jgi:hypothetical protein
VRERPPADASFGATLFLVHPGGEEDHDLVFVANPMAAHTAFEVASLPELKTAYREVKARRVPIKMALNQRVTRRNLLYVMLVQTRHPCHFWGKLPLRHALRIRSRWDPEYVDQAESAGHSAAVWADVHGLSTRYFRVRSPRGGCFGRRKFRR